MGSTKRLVLLSLGLCLTFYYVNAVDVRVVGGDIFNFDRDMTSRLNDLTNRQSYLERELRRPQNFFGKIALETELQNVKRIIAHLESTMKVPYKDYVRAMSNERQNFEREKAELRRRLVEAENARIQAIDALTLQKQEKGNKIDQYQKEVEKLTEQRNRVTKEYAKFVDAFHQQEQKMKEERDKFMEKQEKLHQSLDEAKTKHAQAIEALTAVPAESYKPFNIPEQEEINKLRTDITVFNGMDDRKKLKAGLDTTKKALEELLNRLYNEGKLSPKTSREDMQNALREMEKNTLAQREEQDERRKELIEKMKQKELTDYSEEELQALQKTNAEVAALDTFQKEIERRSAYLRGILEVSDLLKECLDAIRDANDRNLANLWAEAIQEVRDSPLAKSWANAVKETKDNDFAKVWADAIQNANSNIAKAWTDAIREIKDSPLAKMWGEAINNAKASPLAKFCQNAVEDAKCTFSKIMM